MMRTLSALALASLTCAACGTKDEQPIGDNGEPKTIVLPDGTEILDPPPPSSGQQLTSDRFTLNPGEEKYFCYTFRSPSDGVRAITSILPIASKHVHHEVVFQTIADEPEGFFECPILVKASWQPIWAGGAGAHGLDLPSGVAFKIPAHTQYLVQYHLLNAGSEAITTRSGINFTYGENADSYESAGLFALGSFSLEIPASTPDYKLSVKCNSDRTMKVFAAFPHMHQLGTHLTFETGSDEANAQMAYQINPWVFGDQPMEPVDFTINSGDFMRATCSWNNTHNRSVTYGESTNDEMCFMILFYHPFDGLAGCLD